MLVVVLMVLLIGVSYSIYNYNFLGSLNLLEKEMIELKLLEDTTEVINLSNELPISDNEGKAKEETFNFAVTTRTEAVTNVDYSLKIEKLSVDSGYTSLEDSDIKIYLTDYEGNALINPTRIGDLYNYTFYQGTNSHSKENSEIVDKFKLRVWIDWEVDASDWNENTRLQYKFKIGVEGEEYDYDAPNLNPKGQIPEGAYYGTLDIETFTVTLLSEMPDSPSEYDMYIYGDYVYVYSATEVGGWSVKLATEEFFEIFGLTGVLSDYPVADINQTSYDSILESINGKPITNMDETFMECLLLEISPVIPSSVTSMNSTFQWCTSLKTAPAIPSSVTNMNDTFLDCTSLKTAPAIPSSVTNMNDTFRDCTSLKTAPIIPDSVTSMNSTFCGCTSLTGNVEVNANPTSYDLAFHDTAKPIKITGTSSATTKANLASTANNGNVTY